MKKIIFLFLIVYCTLLIPSARDCFSQWQPDVRLTNDPEISQSASVSVSGSVVHVVWEDHRDGNMEIYYKRSIDAGLSWGVDTRLTNYSAQSYLPSVAVSGLVVHVVWYDFRDSNWEIYYKRSTDGGLSWGTDKRMTNNPVESQFPSVTVSGSVVYVVWQDNRDGNREIYYKRSTDAGLSWGVDTRLTNNSAFSEYPSVAVSGSVVHIVWRDDRDMNYEIYYKRSLDGGVSWGADTWLTNNSAGLFRPSIEVSGSVAHVVWYDERDGNREIYYKRSSDGGLSWGTDTRLTNNPSFSESPSVSVSGSAVHVAWHDDRDGNDEIYYKLSLDGGVSWGSDTRLTSDPGVSGSASVVVSGSVVHVVWEDNGDGNWEIYYKRDPTGNPIGIININTEIPKEFSLSQNYPNPFNPKTIINFQLPMFNYVRLIVFDVLGREVETLVNENLKPGTYEIDWDASNFVSGVYFYKLVTSEYKLTRKMILIK